MIQSPGFTMLSLGRGLLGILILLVICYLISSDRKKIQWRIVAGGLLLQLLLALGILYVPFIGILFEWIGHGFLKLLDFTRDGIVFLLGPYGLPSNGFSFLLHSLPIVIFFSALVSLFYHWNIIQRIVNGLSWLLRRFMNISGAEGLVTAGNVFLGMTESPVLIKNYLPSMNRSEIYLVMVCGMATISGALMGTYMGILGGEDPVARLLFAKHLLSASLMAAPGSIVVAKMICPQTEPIDDRVVYLEKMNRHSNSLEALAAGTSTGIKLFVNIAAMLLVFIALVALANFLLQDVVGHYLNINQWVQTFTGGKSTGLTFQFLAGLFLSPLMWLIGIPLDDIMITGSLFGQKTILNEFVAFMQMNQWKTQGLFVYEKSMIMSTYLLCGFANISSIGILIGGLGVLVPEKRDVITRYGFSSMIGGALVSILSATIIGMILG